MEVAPSRSCRFDDAKHRRRRKHGGGGGPHGGFNPNEPRDPQGRWTVGGLKGFVSRSMEGNGNELAILGKISNAADIREATGVDVTGYRRALDSFGVRHSLKVHGKGPNPLVPADFRQVHRITDEGMIKKARPGTSRHTAGVTYRATIDGVTFVMAEDIRPRQKLVVLKTLFRE